MAREFFNDRRKPSVNSAGYQQVAGQVAKADSTPIAPREPAGKRAKAPTAGVDALRARAAAGGGLPWRLLGLVAILLAAVLGAVFVLWPTDQAPVARPTTASDARPSDWAPPTAQSAAENAPAAVAETTPELPAANWEQLVAIGDAHARARQWPQAAADFAAALRVHPDDHWHWFRAATLLAWTQDQTAYRRHCAEMLQRFSDTTHPNIALRSNIAERTAKACLLLPGAADLKTTVRLADQAVAATDHPDHHYFLLARGLAHYRAGEFDKALEQAGKAISGNPKVIGLDTPAHLVVAMSHHQLGQAAEARQALGQARDIMSQDWFPKLETGELAAAWWHDWLICQILYREAEGLIEGKKTP